MGFTRFLKKLKGKHLRRSPERSGDLRRVSFAQDDATPSPRSSELQFARFDPERTLAWQPTATTRDQMLTRSPTLWRPFTDDELGMGRVDSITPSLRRRCSSISSVVTSHRYSESIESLTGHSGPGYQALEEYRRVAELYDIEVPHTYTIHDNGRSVNIYSQDTDNPAPTAKKTSAVQDSKTNSEPTFHYFNCDPYAYRKPESPARVNSGPSNVSTDSTSHTLKNSEMTDCRSDGHRVSYNLESPYDPPTRTFDEWLPMSYARRDIPAPRDTAPTEDLIRSAPLVPVPRAAMGHGDPTKKPTSAHTAAKMTVPAPRTSTIGDKRRIFTSEGLKSALGKIFGPGDVPEEVLAGVPVVTRSSITKSPPCTSDTTNGAGGVMISRSTADTDTRRNSEPHVVISQDERDHVMHYIHGLCNRVKANDTTISRLQEHVNNLQGHVDLFSADYEQLKTDNDHFKTDNDLLVEDIERLKSDNERLNTDNERLIIDADEATDLGRAQMQPSVNTYYAKAQHFETETHKLKTDKHKLHGFVRYIMTLLPTGKKDEAISALDSLDIDLSDETQDRDVKERINAARKEIETVKYWKQRALAAEQWMNGVL